MKKPNFFIVGAAKSATTSLWMYLKQHPDIFMPENIEHKEPSFYCHSYGIRKQKKYLRLFDGANSCKAIGEASTPYLSSPESAAWIHKDIPDAKIIMVLRNPVDRAYSLYRWMVNHGYEWICPFEKALEVEHIRKSDKGFFAGNPQYFYNYLYFESGLYFEQVKRYYSAFPINQIKVILLDELKKNSAATIRDVYRFLGVVDDYEPIIKIHNKGDLRPFSPKFHFMLRSFARRFRCMRKAAIVSYLFKQNLSLFDLCWEKMERETMTMLHSKYRSDIEKTAQLIGQDLLSWLDGMDDVRIK